MTDYLDILANSAMESVAEGYYREIPVTRESDLSLKEAILRCKRAPIVSELKFASPSAGRLRENGRVVEIACEMEEGGAVGISILTEPRHFKGNTEYMEEVRNKINVPILMKDIILNPIQINSAVGMGANAILLMMSIFERDYCEKNVQDMIDYAHSKGLEVLLEAHTEEEFIEALKTSADLIGINNRDLKTLEVDLRVTKRILEKHRSEDRVIVSESGVNNPEDIRFLRDCGAKGFLVGTSIMKSPKIQEKVRELVMSF